MAKTVRHVLSLVVVTAVAVVLAVGLRANASPDDGSRSKAPISALALGVGQDGLAQLERDGNTPMSLPLSQQSEVYVGFRRGEPAITGLMLASGNGGATSSSAGYSPVSDTDVFAGTKNAAQLYATHDASAGEPIVALSLEAASGYVDEPLYALKNDGTEPLRTASGQVANLGVDTASYLFLLRQGVCRPYIGEACVVSGESKEAAVLAAADAGCNYYYDPGQLTADGAYALIGYNRTADAGAALTCITARPAGEDSYEVGGIAFEPMGTVALGGVDGGGAYRLFCSRDAAVGNPIMDLTGSAVPVRATDVVGTWAERTFVKFASATAGRQAQGEEAYLELRSRDDALAHVAVIMARGEAAQGPTTVAPVPDEADAPASDQEQDTVADDPEAPVTAQSGAVVMPLAYVCEEKGQPEPPFAQLAVAESRDTTVMQEEAPVVDDAVTDAQTEAPVADDAVTDAQATSPVQGNTAAAQDVSAGDPVAAAVVDDFDPNAYLTDEAEQIAEHDAAAPATGSIFGAGARGGLALAGGMALVGALAGYGVYRARQRRTAGGQHKGGADDARA